MEKENSRAPHTPTATYSRNALLLYHVALRNSAPHGIQQRVLDPRLVLALGRLERNRVRSTITLDALHAPGIGLAGPGPVAVFGDAVDDRHGVAAANVDFVVAKLHDGVVVCVAAVPDLGDVALEEGARGEGDGGAGGQRGEEEGAGEGGEHLVDCDVSWDRVASVVGKM
jgi:hypothetical protein